jgi:ClpP class serine protease
LRNKFAHIRFIIPSLAKSAATMLVMSGDEILMDTGAELGPIDPQMQTASGSYAPAGAILDQS